MIRRHIRIALAGAALAIAAAPAIAQFSDSFNFLSAVRSADGEKVTKALEGQRATIINTRDYSTGETALMITIKRHDLTWTSFLLGRGANPDVKDFKGNTALHVAALLGFQSGAELLLGQGASVNAANNSGETPLIIAVQQRNPAMVRLLLANGADPKLPDRIAGKSAHDYAAEDPRGTAVLKIIDESKTPVKSKPKAIGPTM
jgi:ankyrin repeat protein